LLLWAAVVVAEYLYVAVDYTLAAAAAAGHWHI
jgi:hypothetical protein